MDLLREAANTHVEAAVAREAKLQALVEAAQEIQRIKGQREVADLKKKLEDSERKAKDAATNLQVVIEGKFLMLPQADFICFTRSRC
jgi:hypothetical protein